jgi:hypothetical protein
MELQPAQLGNIRYAARLGMDNVLMSFDGRDVGRQTEAFSQIEAMCEAFRPDVLICDTIADFFGGNENNRSEVRQFVQNVFGRLARQFNCAALLCAHPSVSGMAAGTGTGGSTAWSNTVRSRLYLTREEGEDADPDSRILTRKKANYASRDAEIRLVWRQGCLVVPSMDDAPSTLPEWDVIGQVFQALDEAWKAKKPWSIVPQSRAQGRYLPPFAKEHFGIPERRILKLIEEWQMNGYLTTDIADTHSKARGLKVLKWLRP